MLYIVLAYLMLFAALTNSVCLNNASFFFLFKYFLCQGYELSGEIALKNNHYYYYYYYYYVASIHGFLTSTVTSTILSAFVLSRIDNCSTLLFGSAHDLTCHLQLIQSYAARVILRLQISPNMTIQLKSLHWLLVKVISICKLACLC